MKYQSSRSIRVHRQRKSGGATRPTSAGTMMYLYILPPSLPLHEVLKEGHLWSFCPQPWLGGAAGLGNSTWLDQGSEGRVTGPAVELAARKPPYQRGKVLDTRVEEKRPALHGHSCWGRPSISIKSPCIAGSRERAAATFHTRGRGMDASAGCQWLTEGPFCVSTASGPTCMQHWTTQSSSKRSY